MEKDSLLKMSRSGANLAIKTEVGDSVYLTLFLFYFALFLKLIVTVTKFSMWVLIKLGIQRNRSSYVYGASINVDSTLF